MDSEQERVAEYRSRYAHAIGMALSVFSEAEQIVGRLFCLAIGARDSEAAYRASWTVISFAGRLNLVDAAIKYAYRDRADILEEWSKTKGRLKDESVKRNQLAHGTIVNHHSSAGVEVVFAPYLFKDMISALSKPLDVEAVEKMAAEFEEARRVVSDFYQLLLREMVKAGTVKVSTQEAAALGLT